MTKTYCDICGKEITDLGHCGYIEFKVEKRVYSWHESWWERMNVHTACWINLCDFFEKESGGGN